ncbi:MAG: DUF126 domain-containing protein [Chloroflexi bacterium]|nr:DUF126 domain-containing protein [Chloroflexota bacterium]
MMAVLKAHKGFGPPTEGEAIVSSDPVHFSTDFDQETGIGKREGHALYGHNIAGRILVAPVPKGGVASSVSLPEMVQNGVGPKAVLFGTANPVLVQAAILAGIAIMDRFEEDPVQAIQTGDYLRVDPQAGLVTVERRAR